MVRSTIIVGLVGLFFSCKKAEDRACFKSYGDLIEKEILLDSVSEFRLYKNITYHIYQDTMRKLIVRTGDKMVNQISAENNENILSISNSNRCHFLRDFDKKTVVHPQSYSKKRRALLLSGTIPNFITPNSPPDLLKFPSNEDVNAIVRSYFPIKPTSKTSRT